MLRTLKPAFFSVHCVRGDNVEKRMAGPIIGNTPETDSLKPNPEFHVMGRKIPGGRFISRLNKDGDGKVSRSEFDGPSQGFSVTTGGNLLGITSGPINSWWTAGGFPEMKTASWKCFGALAGIGTSDT